MMLVSVVTLGATIFFVWLSDASYPLLEEAAGDYTAKIIKVIVYNGGMGACLVCNHFLFWMYLVFFYFFRKNWWMFGWVFFFFFG